MIGVSLDSAALRLPFRLALMGRKLRAIDNGVPAYLSLGSKLLESSVASFSTDH